MAYYDNKSISPFSEALYRVIWLFVFLLVTCSLIREEYIHFADRQPLQQAKQFPPAPARVGEFSFAPVRIGDGKYASHEEYKVRIRYKYVVDGISRFSQQDKFLDYPNNLGKQGPDQWNTPSFLTYTKETEQKMANDFAEGSEHVVRYDPANPSTDFIDIRITPDGAADFRRRMIIFGALFLGAAIWWVVNSRALKMR